MTDWDEKARQLWLDISGFNPASAECFAHLAAALRAAEVSDSDEEITRLTAQYGPWTDPEDGQQWFGLSAQSHRNIQRNLARLNEQLEDAKAALDTAKHHAAVAEWNAKAAHEAVSAGDAAVEWATRWRVLMIIDQAVADCDQPSEPVAVDVLASVRKKVEALGPSTALGDGR